ncbi:hypothetical protein, partial [Streptomyces prunicolor]|uniref:hypothetical protein n=1 Tax=Streptomyces prunicolor TaxID=67348 RepID=UPI0033DBB2AF
MPGALGVDQHVLGPEFIAPRDTGGRPNDLPDDPKILDETRLADAVAHLSPERWEKANRLLIRKALAEFAHER